MSTKKYLFDLNGYIVVENVLTPDEVALCNEAIDHHSESIRERVGELSLSGGSDALEGITGRGDLGGDVGLGKTVVRTVPEICLPTPKSCRIFTASWEKDSEWTTIPA